MTNIKLRAGHSEDCGCPEEDWEINGLFTTIHLEPDGTGHIFIDSGEWEDEKLVDAKTMPELRQAAINWVGSIPVDENL